MRTIILYILAVVCVVAAFVCLAIGWHGNANVSLAVPLAGTTVTFSGAATGIWAFAGICGGILAIIFLVWAVIRTLVARFSRT